MQDLIETRVIDVRTIAQEIKLLEIEPVDAAELPSFSAGAHIDVHFGEGMIRQYSLLNAPAHRSSFRIAVAREVDGRGGSAFLHDHVTVGDSLKIGQPRCHFPLAEDAPYSVLIAGGIGVTPIWCMSQRLAEIGAGFEIHYAARTRAHAALLDEMRALSPGSLKTYFNLEGDPLMDLAAIVAAAPAGSHFYCCGPLPLIEAYRNACNTLHQDHVHFEQFAAAAPAATEGGYSVELARSNLTLAVAQGETILDALAREGIAMSYSCREGICGSCETAVLEGTPDHRDAILTDAEKAQGHTMMICCSGSLGPRLVLDI